MTGYNESINYNASIPYNGRAAVATENYSGYRRRKVRWRDDEPVDPTIAEEKRRAEFEKAFTEALLPSEKSYELPDAPLGPELASAFTTPSKRSHHAALLLLATYV